MHMKQDSSSTPSWFPWLQVVLAACAMVMTIPGRTQGLGLITEPLLQDTALQLDRSQYAWLNLHATLGGALFALPCGWLIDRFGIRWVLVLNVLLLSLGTWYFAAASSMVSFFAGLLMMRGLGQSALSTSSLTLIGKWFPRRVTIAMAVFGIICTIGFIALYSTVDVLIQQTGWRMTWTYLSYSLVGLAVIFLILCRNPAIRIESNEPEDALADAPSSTWSAALRSPLFWLFALSSALFNLVSSGIGLFNEDVLAERGFNHDHFVAALGIATMVTLFSNGLGGWLSTRWPLPRLMAIGMVMLACCLFSLPYLTEVWHVYCNAIFLGTSAGLVIVVFFACWGYYFGTRNLGKIQGTAQGLTVLSSALGPVLLAVCKVYLGTYRPLFIGLAVLSLFSAFLFLRVKQRV